jgi:rhodanese-related sulfurtransferase
MLKNVDVATAKQMMDQGAVMVDVREEYEYAQTCVPGSVNLPLSVFGDAALPEANGKPVVFFCASGNRTAMSATRLAEKAEGREGYVMNGGISGWARAGLPLERGANTGGGFLSRMFARS